MRDMLLKGFFWGVLLIGIMVTGCTTLNQEGTIPTSTLNFSPDANHLHKTTLYSISKIPFSSLPDAKIEPIPLMIVNFSNPSKMLQIGSMNETRITSTPSSERPLFTTFHAGESANDGNTRVTLESVQYNQSFSLEPYNQHGEFRSHSPGYHLMLLTISIRDLGQEKTGSKSPFNNIVIKDSTGERYIPGLSIISDVVDGEGDMTGYLFYEVPVNTAGITLEYHFPDAIGVMAKFNLTQ